MMTVVKSNENKSKLELMIESLKEMIAKDDDEKSKEYHKQQLKQLNLLYKEL